MENAEQVLELYHQLEKDYEDFLENPIGNRHNSREFEVTDGMLQQVSTTYYLLDDARALLDLIEVIEEEAIKIGVIAKAEILLKEMNALDELADLEKQYEKDAVEIAKQRVRWMKQ